VSPILSFEESPTKTKKFKLVQLNVGSTLSKRKNQWIQNFNLKQKFEIKTNKFFFEKLLNSSNEIITF